MADSEGKQHFVGNTTQNMSFVERDKDCIPVMTPSRKPNNTPGPKELFNTRSSYFDQYSSQLHHSLASGKNLLKRSTEQAQEYKDRVKKARMGTGMVTIDPDGEKHVYKFEGSTAYSGHYPNFQKNSGYSSISMRP